ncbi:hypothetical protein GCM10008967_22710 [Bacillus carboniphilus]|uniref:DUF3231 family protein n=1 Tax=Bacillus carboniphilus TaxID=86663 RepID=A0ABP3G1M2_9BACI
MVQEKIHLTAAEIGCLWTTYLNDTMSKCILSHMFIHIQDPDVKPIIEFAHKIVCEHIDFLKTVFEKEQYALPTGFSDQDVQHDAPWLFSDTFCLTYVNQMAKVGMLSYSGFLAMSARDDLRTYFTTCLSETSTLYNRSTEIALNKGVFARHPYMEVPKQVDFIDDKNYFSGLNPFGNKRPLNAIEISHLYMNILTNMIGIKLCLGFAQTSPTKEIQQYMIRGRDISNKHVKIFTETLLTNNIEAPQLPDLSVSSSTTQTFSDKLLMFHMSFLSAAGMGNYATAAAASQRSDLGVNYERLSLEIGQYAKSGADIMIKHNWLEQPPGTIDREELAKNKGSK